MVKRKRVEDPFGRAKTTGLIRKQKTSLQLKNSRPKAQFFSRLLRFRQLLLVAKKLQMAPEIPTINSASATLSIEPSRPCLASLDA